MTKNPIIYEYTKRIEVWHYSIHEPIDKEKI